LKWLCQECGPLEDSEEAEAHEEKGHEVKGFYRPDHLLLPAMSGEVVENDQR